MTQHYYFYFKYPHFPTANRIKPKCPSVQELNCGVSSNYIVVHPYNKKGGKSVTAKTILCNLKEKKWTSTSSQDDITWTFALLKEPEKKKSHKIYRMVFKTAGHQKMMDKGSQQSENK